MCLLPKIVVGLDEMTHAVIDTAPARDKHCRMGACLLWLISLFDPQSLSLYIFNGSVGLCLCIFII